MDQQHTLWKIKSDCGNYHSRIIGNHHRLHQKCKICVANLTHVKSMLPLQRMSNVRSNHNEFQISAAAIAYVTSALKQIKQLVFDTRLKKQ